ncbi:unnamed protein product [Adineta steineri]|uniref:Potassium channel domain-containing protein n=3 Tax=Adineta steineri TaxID=433720 RepID=A0A815MQM6_9BILA|nr:unnamed protein product [Adineta steineri]CAF3524557.1 unnamed protein product [Adineta steineri]CAF3755287.1 unnamed protein product [Adineta steineri]
MCNRHTTKLNLFLLTITFIIYLFVGAQLFSTIERPAEQIIINEMSQTRKDFLEKYPCVKENDFESFIVTLLDANKHGVDARTNFTTVDNWSFAQSFFFAVTVVTTIGYGHVSPLSDTGRIICIVYAIFGVPMTLLLLSVIVRKLLILLNNTYLWFRYKFSSDRRSESKIRFIHLSLVLIFSLIFLFIIPSIIFTYLEESWSFIDAFYFCFISLTTIGLGDLVAGDSPTQRNRLFYKVCLTIYLLVGVTIMMLVIAMVSQIPELRLIQFFLSGKEVEDENERVSTTETSGLLWLSRSSPASSYGIRNSTTNQPYRRQTNEKTDPTDTPEIITKHDLYSYVDYFLDKSHTGLWHSSSSKANVTKWTFGQGLLFVTSLLTTVGKKIFSYSFKDLFEIKDES